MAAIRHWLRSFFLMTVWELRSFRMILPFSIIVQILLGAGLVIGYGFLIGDLPELEALYLTTGLAVVSMITIGMVLAPQLIAQQRAGGVYDYIWSLPVPRTTTVASSLLIHSLIATPGLIITLLVAAWRFDLDFVVKPLLVPALTLTLVTAASIGFALAHGIKNEMTIGLITQVLVFFILLYSPISFPSDRLPGWLGHNPRLATVRALCQHRARRLDRRHGH